MSARRHEGPSADAAPEAVQWHEGMMLAPQHMQQEARRIEATLNYQMRAATPFFWGVRFLEFDAGALFAGCFRVVALDALLPDGLVVAHPRPGAAALELDLGALDLDLAVRPVTIHLAVAAHSARAAAPGALRRYLSVAGDLVLDENLGENPVATPRLRPALTLHATSSPMIGPGASWVSLPIAQVARVGGRMELAPYQPPALRVTREQPVHAVARSVAEDLRDKATGVSERLKGAAAGLSVETREDDIALRAISGPLPRLEALLRDEAASPYQLHLALCDALGAAASVDRRLAPPSAPAYLHEDALPGFEAMARMVLGAMARLRAAHRLVAFERLDAGSFVNATGAGGGEAVHLLMYAAPGDGAQRVAQWAARACIASSERMAEVQLSRVRGAARRLVESVDALDIVAPDEGVLAAVTLDPRFIDAGAPLEIRHPEGGGQPGEPARIVLVLPLDDAGDAT